MCRLLIYLCHIVALTALCPSGARAACARPRLTAVSGATHTHSGIHPLSYGDTLHLFCSGTDHRNLTIILNGLKQAVDVVNATTIKHTLETPATNFYQYNCTENDCGESLTVHVRPKAVVIPELRDVVNRNPFRRNGTTLYVRNLEDFELICLGPAENLRITNTRWMDDVPIESEIINSTAIKFTSKHQDVSNEIYKCVFSTKDIVTTERVNILVTTAASYIWCNAGKYEKAYSYTSCDFNFPSIMPLFYTLFILDEHGNSSFICSGVPFGYDIDVICVWDINEYQQQHGIHIPDRFSLVMETCYYNLCANETYNIDRSTILVARKPNIISFGEETTHSAVVSWDSSPLDHNNHSLALEHRVVLAAQLKYEYAENLNISLRVNCTSTPKQSTERCTLELRLPCSGTTYRVKLASRFKKSLRRKSYWSDYTGYFPIYTEYSIVGQERVTDCEGFGSVWFNTQLLPKYAADLSENGVWTPMHRIE